MNTKDPFDYSPPTPRPGTANNLPGALTPRGTGWRHPILKAAKLFTWMAALTRAGSEMRLVLSNDWASLGVRPAVYVAEVRRLMPYLDEGWEELGKTGKPEGSGKLPNRLWHMYRFREKQGGPPVASITVEHPLRSKNLQPYVEHAHRLFVKGKPVPREVIEELFS